MLSVQYVEEMMSRGLIDPMDLAVRLNLRPRSGQVAIMSAFAEGLFWEGANSEDDDAVRAAAVCALWYALRTPGSRVTVVSGDARLLRIFMGFLTGITKGTDPALSAVTTIKRWNHLQFGADPGWQIRTQSNMHDPKTRSLPAPHMVVVLGCKSTDAMFVETQKALLGAEHEAEICVW